MKKIAAFLAAFILAAYPRFAMASGQYQYVVFTGVVSNTVSANYDFTSWDYVNVRVKCTANCPASAQVLLCKLYNATDQPYCSTTVTNPSTTGEYWGIAISPLWQAQVVNWVSGTIEVDVDVHKR